MNKAEKKVQQFLKNKFGFEPVFEPKGNRTPDFEIDDLAIEARTFNYNYYDKENNAEGLLSADKAIQDCTDEVLQSFSKVTSNPHYYLKIYYKRPIDDYSKYKKKLNAFLLDIERRKPKNEETHTLTNNITITAQPHHDREDSIFKIGSLWDQDKFNWLIPTFCRNLEEFISEKSNSIIKYKNEYSQWWLVLYHNKLVSLEPHEYMQIESLEFNKGSFNKVLVINKTLDEIFSLE